jgi:hypothetical protein
MKTRTMWMTIAVVAALLLVAGGAGALAGRAEPEAIVADKINYQGWLTDAGGTPLDGTFPMRFQLYDDPAAGAMYWDSGILNVEVTNGRFSVDLDVDPALFDGKALWLRIYVDGEWLAPRQELLPVPYALSLRPGARIVGDIPAGWDVELFQLSNLATGGALRATSATGTAIHGYSANGFGVAGYSHDSYAVYGYDGGSQQARGYAGYFHSDNGIGVFGYSAALDEHPNDYAPGVYGRSANGVGVYGVSESTQPGIRGESADGNGVYGISTNDIGLYGQTGGQTIYDYGVYGQAGGLGYGVYGYQSATATGGLGVYGKNEGGGSGVSGLNNGAGNGTWGYSVSYNGVGGATNRVDSNYGLYTQDNLYSLNYHTLGATMQVVQNGDDEPLEMGDVVAIAGLGAAPTKGMSPVIQVRKTSKANSTAVVGVVASSYSAEWLKEQADPTGVITPDKAIPETGPGPIGPGEYLLVVVQGPCQVKAEAIAASIQPGDLLSSGQQTGYAAKAPEMHLDGATLAAPGTVLGKALEAMDNGQKLLYIYVTLQ